MMVEDIAVRVGQRWGLDSWGFLSGRPSSNNKCAADNAVHDPALKNIHMVYTKSLVECEQHIQDYRPDLLIVDYLQLLDIGKSSRLEGTTKNSQALKDLAIRYSMPVLCLSQLRRPDRDTKPQPPSLHDLRDSGSIEQDADVVIFVYREMVEGTRSAKDEGAFHVAKARMGERGIVEFVFDGPMQTFHLVDNNHLYTRS
jgi:replicative DNA helicase